MLTHIADSTISKTQIKLLYLLFRFRFLTKRHIQELLQYKDDRQIRIWLKDLKEKQLIQTKTIEEGENIGKTVYFLTINSRDILKTVKGTQIKELDKIKREHQRTDVHINHCLFLVKIYFKFKELVKDNTLYFFTKTDMANFKYFFTSRPELYIAIEVNGKVIKRYFLDYFDHKAKKSQMKKRIEEYIEYFISNEWEVNTKHPYPLILFIAPDKDMKNYLYRCILAQTADEGLDISFFLATKKAVTFHGVSKDVWQKII